MKQRTLSLGPDARKLRDMADEIRPITMAEAAAMPGILGAVMTCNLREFGFYARGEKAPDGSVRKVFYELKENFPALVTGEMVANLNTATARRAS